MVIVAVLAGRATMRSYVFYGFDRDGRLVLTEASKLARADDALKQAADLLLKYRKVEVWDGPARIFRSDVPKSRAE